MTKTTPYKSRIKACIKELNAIKDSEEKEDFPNDSVCTEIDNALSDLDDIDFDDEI